MTYKFKLRASMGCAVTLTVLLSAGGLRGDVFECPDDFEDGSIKDGNPCTWVTESQGVFCAEGDHRVEDGKLILTNPPPGLDFVGTYPGVHVITGDVSVEFQGTWRGSGGLTAWVHCDSCDGGGYVAQVFYPSGEVWYGSEIVGNPQYFMKKLEPPPVAGEDLVFKLDIRGSLFQVRIWRPNEEMPEEPFVTMAVNPMESGISGINFRPLSAGAEGVFEYVYIFGSPEANMTVDPESGTAPLEVTVDGSLSATGASRSLESYKWDFGDGAVAEGAQATHTYAAAGQYMIRLTVTDSRGLSSTANRLIHVGPPAACATCFECSDDFEDGSIKDGNPCTWVTESQGVFCADGDHRVEGGKLILSNPPPGLPFVGTYPDTNLITGDVSVQFQATVNGSGALTAWIHAPSCTGTAYGAQVYYPSGEVWFGYEIGGVHNYVQRQVVPPPSPNEDLVMRFDYTGGMLQLRIWRPDAVEIPELWTMAVPALQGGMSGINFAPAAAGAQGVFDYVWIFGPPEANMTVDPESGPAPLEVTVDGSLSATGASRSLASYKWDFGDGAVAEGAQATHTYAESGEYTIRLTVTDSRGLTSSATQLVQVSCPPGDTAPWQTAGIGQRPFPNSAGFEKPESPEATDDLHLCTSGTKIASTSDECLFLYQEMAGDFRITASIASVDHMAGAGCSGVMVRQSLDVGAITGATLLNGSPTASSRRVRFSFRPQDNAAMQNRLENIGSGEAPVWVRLERRGQTLAASYSLDGAAWTPAGEPEEIPGLPDTLVAGVAACKGAATEASGHQAVQAVITNLTIVPLPLFLRGDANDDGKAEMSDAVRILNVLFIGGETISCKDAADVNDDGTVDISDPVRLLGHLFLGWARPPDPYGTCGFDLTVEKVALDCKTFSACP